MAVQIPFILSLIKRQYLKKVHTDTHEPANVFASIKCKKNPGQVTFFRQLVQGQAGHFRISPPLHYNIQLFVLSSEFSVSMLVKTVNDATPCYKTFNLDMKTKHY